MTRHHRLILSFLRSAKFPRLTGGDAFQNGPHIITDYPGLLHSESERERCSDITARRVRYFRQFAGAPWHMPALNDQSIQNAANGQPHADRLAGSVLSFFHEEHNV